MPDPRLLPPGLLPVWIPDLQSSEVESSLQQRRQPAFVPIWKRGHSAQWTVELQNHGGGGTGLVVELRGAAFKKPALDVLQAEAFFATDGQIHLARRSRLKEGLRFTFGNLALTPPAKQKAEREPRPRSAKAREEAAVERHVRSALGQGPFLRFTCKALSTPSRVRALGFSLSAKPEGALEGGFMLSAWYGHPDLAFSEFF